MGKKREVTNTTEMVRRDPLFGMAATAFGGGIEGMEARGQREFVDSDVLPAHMGGRDSRAILASAGVVLGEMVDGDPLFQYAKLPAGWTRRPTNHSMWSELVDGKGRVRASIFYKAAFYDRKAHLRLAPRFTIEKEYPDEPSFSSSRTFVRDGERIIFDAGWHTHDPESAAFVDQGREACEAWLHENRPGWDDLATCFDREWP